MRLKISTPKGIYRYKFVPIYLGMKPIDKAIAKENLLLLNDICHKNNLQFILYYGTLLGAVREHDFIAHDEDIDLAMKMEDLPKLLSMLFELREAGFEVARFERGSLLSIIRKGEYIDFYFFDDFEGRPDLVYCCRDVFERKYIEDLMPYTFLGEEFLIPREYVKYNEFYFGDDWQTPIQFYDFGQSKSSRTKDRILQYIKAMIPEWILERTLYRTDKNYWADWINKIDNTVGEKMTPTKEAI